jgi:ATP-binding cassette, sub-family E, member 1
VGDLLQAKLETDRKDEIIDNLDLNAVLEREVSQLSGGELQRFAIAMTCVQRADMCVLLSVAFSVSHMEGLMFL